MAVDTDAAAVMALTNPASQYEAFHMVQISIK
jgi:hypothetical protein